MKILDALEGVKKTGHGKWKAICPSHPDKNPSLTITEKDDKILLKCWSGCTTKEILDAADLTWDDLFFTPLSKDDRTKRRKVHLKKDLQLEVGIMRMTEIDRNDGSFSEKDYPIGKVIEREKLAFKRLTDAGYKPDSTKFNIDDLEEI